MTDIWLHLSAENSMAVDRHEAMTMNETQLASLYAKHVLSSTESEAIAWAKGQVEERSEAIYLDWYFGDGTLKDYWPEEYKCTP